VQSFPATIPFILFGKFFILDQAFAIPESQASNTMKTRTEKKQATPGRSLTGNSPQRLYHHNTAAAVPADNRPEAVAQRKLQELANNSPQVKQGASWMAKAGGNASTNVIQARVQIGTNIYKAYDKSGYGIKNLIALIEANKGAIVLRYDWKAKIRTFVNDDDIYPRPFNNLADLINYLIKPNRKTTREKNQEQDQRIQGLNTGFGATELQYGQILSYESQRAFDRFSGQVQDMQQHTDTQMELESYAPGPRSTTSDFTHTNNPFINLLALQSAGNNLQRLDYMAPHGVQVTTHGYESRGDRTVSQSSLGTNFGLGPMKIGPDIGSYKSEMDSPSHPDQHQLTYLNALEMLRFPHLSPQTAIKRELYDQGHFDKNQGLGFNHNHSSVEFVGAISGSSMSNDQLSHLRRQQTYSNYAILQSAYNICPDAELGQALGAGIHIPTSREEMDALTHFVQVVSNPFASQDQKDDAKRALRKVLTQVLRAVTQIEDVHSEDEGTYPTSPYDPGHY
jgi:hypothetical protein